ncbi:GntR family transcriptional repressor for pyruvate dehydrogenase complex [Lachnospiraceae bacterium PF1-21]|uniref:FadR family transcriptional regulator n=1 Tax=Ohessyouella blattaphilus TaxID=2949333 RepID=A0ABT1EI22_9FIRM|nr:FadR/GntR family transcriptional regulator [Ohessyouella blattaphilus]MCP1110349.1 FadR family transcriptional regulator [Ohessyouella blattaphilus]MCR8563743.1 FadR family transcriptional regulator [Ohessyouella blattaphilus]
MADFSNIKNRLLAQEVEERIVSYIFSEPIPVGGKLPNEFKLGEMFGAGRSTVREAVKSLVSKGMLEIRRGSGTYVADNSRPLEDPLGLGGIEDKISLALDLVDVRIMLEPGIAGLAALNATKEEIITLEKLCDLVEKKIKNDEPYIQEDIQFHAYIAECSKNKVVEQLIPIIDTAVLMFVNVTHKKLIDETIMTHRNVVEAIKERDPVGAKTAMMMHMTFNRNMIKLLEKEK